MLTELPDVERVRKFLNWKVMLSGHAENTQAQVEYSVNWSQRRLWGWGWCLSGYYYCGFLVFFFSVARTSLYQARLSCKFSLSHIKPPGNMR